MAHCAQQLKAVLTLPGLPTLVELVGLKEEASQSQVKIHIITEKTSNDSIAEKCMAR